MKQRKQPLVPHATKPPYRAATLQFLSISLSEFRFVPALQDHLRLVDATLLDLHEKATFERAKGSQVRQSTNFRRYSCIHVLKLSEFNIEKRVYCRNASLKKL
jgi:hypothetical protein